MPYKLRIFECAGCGQEVERRGPPGSRVRCITCAIERSAENARQLRAHSGLFYVAWADAVAAAAAREQQYAAIGAQVDALDWPDLR